MHQFLGCFCFAFPQYFYECSPYLNSIAHKGRPYHIKCVCTKGTKRCIVGTPLVGVRLSLRPFVSMRPSISMRPFVSVRPFIAYNVVYKTSL